MSGAMAVLAISHDAIGVEVIATIGLVLVALIGLAGVWLQTRHMGRKVDDLHEQRVVQDARSDAQYVDLRDLARLSHAESNSSLTASLRAQLTALRVALALSEELLANAIQGHLPTEVARGRVIELRNQIEALELIVQSRESPPPNNHHERKAP